MLYEFHAQSCLSQLTGTRTQHWDLSLAAEAVAAVEEAWENTLPAGREGHTLPAGKGVYTLLAGKEGHTLLAGKEGHILPAAEAASPGHTPVLHGAADNPEGGLGRAAPQDEVLLEAVHHMAAGRAAAGDRAPGKLRIVLEVLAARILVGILLQDSVGMTYQSLSGS